METRGRCSIALGITPPWVDAPTDQVQTETRPTPTTSRHEVAEGSGRVGEEPMEHGESPPNKDQQAQPTPTKPWSGKVNKKPHGGKGTSATASSPEKRKADQDIEQQEQDQNEQEQNGEQADAEARPGAEEET